MSQQPPRTHCRAAALGNLTLHSVAAPPHGTTHSVASRCPKRSTAAAMNTVAGQRKGQHDWIASGATLPASLPVHTPFTWCGQNITCQFAPAQASQPDRYFHISVDVCTFTQIAMFDRSCLFNKKGTQLHRSFLTSNDPRQTCAVSTQTVPDTDFGTYSCQHIQLAGPVTRYAGR